MFEFTLTMSCKLSNLLKKVYIILSIIVGG